jgi:hypothetical protein
VGGEERLRGMESLDGLQRANFRPNMLAKTADCCNGLKLESSFFLSRFINARASLGWGWKELLSFFPSCFVNVRASMG